MIELARVIVTGGRWSTWVATAGLPAANLQQTPMAQLALRGGRKPAPRPPVQHGGHEEPGARAAAHGAPTSDRRASRRSGARHPTKKQKRKTDRSIASVLYRAVFDA